MAISLHRLIEERSLETGIGESIRGKSQAADRRQVSKMIHRRI
jgi:hypothetical protein